MWFPFLKPMAMITSTSPISAYESSRYLNFKVGLNDLKCAYNASIHGYNSVD